MHPDILAPSDTFARRHISPTEAEIDQMLAALGYRSLEEPKRIPWRDANQEVGRVGGHVGILREQAAREKPSQGERK